MTFGYLSFRMTQVILYRVFNIIYKHPLVFKLSKLYPIQANAVEVMHKFSDDVIQKRRADLLTDGSESSEADDTNAGDDVGIRKKRALLDILLHSTIDDKPMNDDDIREEVIIIIIHHFSFVTFSILHRLFYSLSLLSPLSQTDGFMFAVC